jgi:hypothetical protein
VAVLYVAPGDDKWVMPAAVADVITTASWSLDPRPRK